MKVLIWLQNLKVKMEENARCLWLKKMLFDEKTFWLKKMLFSKEVFAMWTSERYSKGGAVL